MATSTAKKTESKAGSADAGSGKPLKIHHLKPSAGANTPKTRVGRGEGSKGKTAGRGTKGTKARGTVPARFEGGQMPLHMRLPKLKGFKNKFRVSYEVVNLDKLAQVFSDGDVVDLASLYERGLVNLGRPVKILGTGDLAGVKLQVTANAFSSSAKEKIEAAGGTATQL